MTYKLSILATTDIHGHVSLYDYFTNTYSEQNGLIMAGSLIHQIKSQNDLNQIETLIVDNGDILQGSIVADYAAEKNLDLHPVIEMMNEIGYEAGTLGNHEFNYGLDYLELTKHGAEFPFVNCNVKYMNGDFVVKPYTVVEKTFSDNEKLKIGITGVVPEQVLMWDEKYLNGKVIVEDMYDALYQYASQMKASGCDIVVALMHTGLDQEHLNFDELEGMENQVYKLAQIDAVDACIFGHTHQVFPGEDYNGIDNVVTEKGKIFNTYAVQPKCFGSHVGEIMLDLAIQNGKWTVLNGQSTVHDISKVHIDINEHYISVNDKHHRNVLDYTKAVIGSSSQHIESYFAQVAPSAAVEVVARSGKDKYLSIYPAKKNDRIIATSAPLKAGRDGVTDYVDIKAGDLTLKDAISIYRFPNKMSAVRIPGRILKEWVEWSVSCFNETDAELLVKDNKSTAPGFPSYNMDIFYELSYMIDLEKPPRYNPAGEQINSETRIEQLRYNGILVNDDDMFTVLTNDYRMNFTPILQDDAVVKIQLDEIEVRQAVIDYIKTNGIDFEPVLPYTFKQKGKYRIKSSPDAVSVADQYGMRPLQLDDEGYMIYEFNV